MRNYGTDIFVVESIAVFDTIHKNLCPVTVPVKTFIIPFFVLGKNRALTSLGGVSCTLYYMGEKNMKAKPPFTAVVYNTRRCNGRRRNTTT